MIDKMDRVVRGEYGQKKLTVFSGHDDNIAPILTFLNLTSAHCVQEKYRNETVKGNCAEPVPFASSLQLEIHVKNISEGSNLKYAPDNYYVRLRYNGDYYHLC